MKRGLSRRRLRNILRYCEPQRSGFYAVSEYYGWAFRSWFATPDGPRRSTRA